MTNNDRDNNRYVVVDIETTGFSAAMHSMTEIGAVMIENGEIVDEFCQLINPGIPIPPGITKLTGITDEMVKDKPSVDVVLQCFFEFCAGCTLVAHNASFDMGFIRFNAEKHGMECNFNVLDTLRFARRLFPELANHKLNTVAHHLNVELIGHHRAMGDAKATAHIFLKCMKIMEGYCFERE